MRWRNVVPRLLDNLIWIILLGVIVFFATQSDKFLSAANLRNVLVAASVLGLLVVGQTFVLLTGNFDLSAESTLGLAGLVGLWLIVPAGVPTRGGDVGLNPYLAIVVVLLLGGVIGWINGTLITVFKMNNFIVTLAMLIIVRGAILRFNDGQAVTAGDVAGAATFAFLGHGNLFTVPWLGRVPVSVLVVVATYAVAWVVLHHRPFGRELYAIGGNRAAALASGVDPDRRVRQAYVISGAMAAFAGWMLAGRLGSVQQNLGEGMIFNVFAAAVIGGISLQGGRGAVVGAFGGVLLLASINAGLNLMRVSVFWVQAIQGFVILIAMFIDAQKVRFRGAPDAASAAPGGAAAPVRPTAAD